MNCHFSKDDMQMANKQMKRCSTSLVSGWDKPKPQLRCHLTPNRTAVIIVEKCKTTYAGEDVESLGPHAHMTGENVQWRTAQCYVAQQFPPGYIRERTESKNSNKYLHSHVHSSQTVETTPVSTSTWRINMMSHTHTHAHTQNIIQWLKRKEKLIHATS